MNTKTDEGLYEKARKLFISKACVLASWRPLCERCFSAV